MESVKSDIPGFTGEVVFKDFITLDIVENWLQVEGNTNIPLKERQEMRFEAMCAFVHEWHIEENNPDPKRRQPIHPTHKTFRATPYLEAAQLIRLVTNAIKRELTGIKEIPNGSGSEPSGTPKTPTTTPDPQS